MNKKWLLPPIILFLAGITVAGCSGLVQSTTQPPTTQSPATQSLVTQPSATQSSTVQSSTAQSTTSQSNVANGEMIYFRAVDQNGNRIAYTGGPNFGGMMMGGYLTCASCHGPDAHGGQHVMHMQVMDAPPVYYDALNTMLAQDSNGTAQPGGYSLKNFRAEVIDGKDVDGTPLNANMPRWQMSDQDLADLFAFLKTIQK